MTDSKEQSMMRSIACITWVAVMCLSGHARAEVPSGPDVAAAQSSEPVLLTLVGDQGNFRVPVYEGIGSIVFLPNDVRHWEILTDSLERRYRVESSDFRLRIIPHGKPRENEVLHVYVETAAEHVNLLTYVADSPDDAARPRVVQKEDQQQRIAAMVHTEAEKRTEEIRATWEAERDEREERLERERYRRRMHAQPMVPSTRDGCSVGPLRVCIARGEWDGDELVLTLEVANTDVLPHLVTGSAVNDHTGKLFAPRLVVFDEFATDVKGEVAEVPPGGKTQVTVTVPGASDGDFRSLSLELQAPDIAKPVVAAVDKWRNNPFFEPKSKAEIEAEKREEEEKARERAAKGRITLHVQGIYGGIWLANPLDDSKLDVTDVRGLGMRLTYGLSSLLAVEVNAVGASSGDSQFKDVDYNGQQGDLLRRATLGRVSFGGVLRLGSGTFIPVMRLGLGIQGASHTAEMDVGGVRMPGPDVGFQLKGMWSIGAGLDVRLGDHIVGGLSVSFDQLVSDPSSTLKAGAHLGYAWTP